MCFLRYGIANIPPSRCGCSIRWELLFQLLTRTRWNIIKAIMAAGAISILEIARRAERDIPAVNRDVHALLN